MSDHIERGAVALHNFSQEVLPISEWPGVYRREMTRRAEAAYDAFHPSINGPRSLDSLPVGSVVLDRDGDAWQRTPQGWNCTVVALNTANQSSETLAAILGPFTIIWEPKS